MTDRINATESFDKPRVNRPPCMTDGCSINCSFGYSCHEQRMGRAGHIAWPFIALGTVLLIGLVL